MSDVLGFELEKGMSFDIDKGVQRVRAALAWDDTGEGFDPDASAIGLAHLSSGKPVFFGSASHVVSYANKSRLKVSATGQFMSKDDSISHSGDDRTGSGEDSEVITIDFSKVPTGLEEIAIWVTIYKAVERKQNFGMMKNCKITIKDVDAKNVLASYKLREEFANALSVQVGSFVHMPTGAWEFTAVGAGAAVELGQVLAQYS